MVDCHIHMVLDGDWWRTALDRHNNGPDMPWIRQILARYREAGFTWLRDGGDRWGVGAAARALAPEYGITYRTPLAPLCMEGHYGSFIGLTYGSLKEYAQLVRSQKAQGADFIKIMISGRKTVWKMTPSGNWDTPPMKRAWRLWPTATARKM